MKLRRAVFLPALMLLAIVAKPQQPESQAPMGHTTQTKVVLLGTGTPVPESTFVLLPLVLSEMTVRLPL